MDTGSKSITRNPFGLLWLSTNMIAMIITNRYLHFPHSLLIGVVWIGLALSGINFTTNPSCNFITILFKDLKILLLILLGQYALIGLVIFLTAPFLLFMPQMFRLFIFSIIGYVFGIVFGRFIIAAGRYCWRRLWASKVS